MKSGAEKTLRRALVAACVLGLSACGGDNSVRPPVTVITPQPVRGVIAQTSISRFDSGTFVSLEIPITQKGVVDIAVDWTFPDTWMYVYMGNVNCSYAQLAAQTCPFFLSSETKDPKPRLLTTQSLDAGTYYLVLYNRIRDPLTGQGSDNTESVSIQLGLTVYPFTNKQPGISIGRTQVLGPQS